MLRRISVKTSACQFGSGFYAEHQTMESKIYNAESERYLLYRNAKSSFQMMEEEVIGNSRDYTLFGDDKNCQWKDEYHFL